MIMMTSQWWWRRCDDDVMMMTTTCWWRHDAADDVMMMINTMIYLRRVCGKRSTRKRKPQPRHIRQELWRSSSTTANQRSDTQPYGSDVWKYSNIKVNPGSNVRQSCMSWQARVCMRFTGLSPSQTRMQVDASWQTRVCMDLQGLAWLIARSNENKSCMRVDESWPDITA